MSTPAPPAPCPLAEPLGCCPFCCSPASYIGKSLNRSRLVQSWSIGADVDVFSYVYSPNGIFVPGPNTFPVLLHEVDQTFSPGGAPPNYGGCFAMGAMQSESIYDSEESISIGCDPSGFYFPGVVPGNYAALYARSLLPNSGYPIGCYEDSGSSFTTVSTTTYTSSCFGISIHEQRCTYLYMGVTDCSGEAQLFSWIDLLETVTIA